MAYNSHLIFLYHSLSAPLPENLAIFEWQVPTDKKQRFVHKLHLAVHDADMIRDTSPEVRSDVAGTAGNHLDEFLRDEAKLTRPDSKDALAAFMEEAQNDQGLTDPHKCDEEWGTKKYENAALEATGFGPLYGKAITAFNPRARCNRLRKDGVQVKRDMDFAQRQQLISDEILKKRNEQPEESKERMA